MGPGILGAILGKMDNYSNLPVADQAFIAKNMKKYLIGQKVKDQ